MAGVITGEFLGGRKGLGEFIRVAASQLDTPHVFSLIYVSLLGVSTFGLVLWVPLRILAEGQRGGRCGAWHCKRWPWMPICNAAEGMLKERPS